MTTGGGEAMAASFKLETGLVRLWRSPHGQWAGGRELGESRDPEP